MKDFIKWLGVNEKVAKVVLWIFMIMVFLIVFNTAMESLGFPYYAITYDNLIKIKYNVVLEHIMNWLVLLLNFYAIVLLVFSIKESKKIFKYAVLYMILNILLTIIATKILMHLFIIIYIIVFCYLYSNKNYKYILYAIISIIINTVVQGIDYYYKIRFIDYTTLNQATKAIISLDYFIIIGVIILVKEIYLKKRGEKNGNMLVMVRRIQKRKQISKETSKKSSKHS